MAKKNKYEVRWHHELAVLAFLLLVVIFMSFLSGIARVIG